MANEPDNLVLQLLRELREDIANTQSQINSLRADVASDLLTMQAKNEAEHKATREQVVGLRRAVVEYHSAVLGHGMLISDLEARVRRLEQKLGVSDA
ncbi:MAG: hypothetical protein ACR650_00980 [Methylocystis sp.]|jgi:chromosome segregation ATPase